MKLLTHNFRGNIEVHLFSDWHLGDALSNLELIKQRIEYVRVRNNARVVCLGDLIDCAIVGSKGDTYGAVSTPGEAINILSDLLWPVRNKIIAWVEGNHEDRVYRTTGISINSIVSDRIESLDVYDPLSVQLELVGSGASYTGYLTHSSGGGGTVGAKANSSQRLSAVVQCDLYLSGHTHMPLVFSSGYLQGNTMCPQLYITSGAALSYGGYGERGVFKPSSFMQPVLLLNGETKQMSVRMS